MAVMALGLSIAQSNSFDPSFDPIYLIEWVSSKDWIIQTERARDYRWRSITCRTSSQVSLQEQKPADQPNWKQGRGLRSNQAPALPKLPELDIRTIAIGSPQR